jgi:hypothetical protein
MQELLAQYGLSPTIVVVVAVVLLIIVVLIATNKGGDMVSPGEVCIMMHPEQTKWMLEKQVKYAGKEAAAGKGIRCILDYMRELTPGQVKEILAEPEKHKDGLEVFSMSHVHPGQLSFLAEYGITMGKEDGNEKFEALGKAFRAMIDYAMRMEKDKNDNVISEMYENVRCINC